MKHTLCAIGCILAMNACSSVSPDAGTEAVLIRKPMFFGHGGVDPVPVKPGLQWVAWTTQREYVDMKPQRVDLVFDDLMTSSGVPIDFHAVFSYQVTDSIALVQKFGNDTITYEDKTWAPGFFARNLDQPFRSAVRDAVKKRDMQAMAITAIAAEEVDAEVTTHLERLIRETGVPIKLIDLSLGRANPPDAIKHQRIETAAQEQRIITEQQRKLAEDQRKMAEESRAAADQAYNAKMGLSSAQYVALEAIKMQRDACASGKCTFFVGGGVVPTVDVGR